MPVKTSFNVTPFTSPPIDFWTESYHALLFTSSRLLLYGLLLVPWPHYISLNFLETMKLQRNATATIMKQMIVHHTGTLISNCSAVTALIGLNSFTGTHFPFFTETRFFCFSGISGLSSSSASCRSISAIAAFFSAEVSFFFSPILYTKKEVGKWILEKKLNIYELQKE